MENKAEANANNTDADDEDVNRMANIFAGVDDSVLNNLNGKKVENSHSNENDIA